MEFKKSTTNDIPTLKIIWMKMGSFRTLARLLIEFCSTSKELLFCLKFLENLSTDFKVEVLPCWQFGVRYDKYDLKKIKTDF